MNLRRALAHLTRLKRSYPEVYWDSDFFVRGFHQGHNLCVLTGIHLASKHQYISMLYWQSVSVDEPIKLALNAAGEHLGLMDEAPFHKSNLLELRQLLEEILLWTSTCASLMAS